MVPLVNGEIALNYGLGALPFIKYMMIVKPRPLEECK